MVRVGGIDYAVMLLNPETFAKLDRHNRGRDPTGIPLYAYVLHSFKPRLVFWPRPNRRYEVSVIYRPKEKVL